MADKIKDVAVEEADRIKSLASDAARSGAYLYPLRVRSFNREKLESSKIGLIINKIIEDFVADNEFGRASHILSPTAPYGNLLLRSLPPRSA